MKKILLIVIVLLLVSYFTSCNFVLPEEPVPAYSEKIDVVVTKIDKKQWFAGTVQREVTVTVYNKEYNITGKYTEHYVGTFGNMPLWEYEKGDIVKARIITFVMKSTGEITKRYIDKVY